MGCFSPSIVGSLHRTPVALHAAVASRLPHVSWRAALACRSVRRGTRSAPRVRASHNAPTARDSLCPVVHRERRRSLLRTRDQAGDLSPSGRTRTPVAFAKQDKARTPVGQSDGPSTRTPVPCLCSHHAPHTRSVRTWLEQRDADAHTRRRGRGLSNFEQASIRARTPVASMGLRPTARCTAHMAPSGPPVKLDRESSSRLRTSSRSQRRA